LAFYWHIGNVRRESERDTRVFFRKKVMMKPFVLVVEDNEQDELLTIRALKKNGIENEIIVTRDGAQALDFLFCKGQFASRDSTRLPRVVLLDLKLPKLNGLEVLRALRSDPRTRFLPVVVLTTSTEERDLVEVYDNGANSYVRKPVDYNEFTETIRNLGTYWLDLNRVPASA
jgi:two-component system response regulator